jgi:hypothetical protein
MRRELAARQLVLLSKLSEDTFLLDDPVGYVTVNAENS